MIESIKSNPTVVEKAKDLLYGNFSVEIIQEVTHLPIEEINSLKLEIDEERKST